MATQSFPFDNSPIPTEDEWDLIARSFKSSGVLKTRLNKLETYANSTGMNVKVKSGEALLDGKFFRSDAESTLAMSAAHATLARIDRVVAELDRAANTVTLKVVPGTAAGSPTAPGLTQSDTGIWQVPLARVAVGAAVSTIAAGNVTDERMWAGRQCKAVEADAAVTTISTIITDISGMSVEMFTKGGDIKADFNANLSLSVASGAFVLLALALDGAAKNLGSWQPWSASASDFKGGHVTFQNVAPGLHTIAARWLVSAGTGSASFRRLTVEELLD